MTIETDIQDALIARLKASPVIISAASIANPLVAFDPSGLTQYLAVHAILRAQPLRPALGFTGAVVRRGIFQVDAVIKDGLGERPGLVLAGSVASRFAIGTELVAGSYRLQLDKEPTIAAAVKDAPWVRFPVSIPYLVIS